MKFSDRTDWPAAPNKLAKTLVSLAEKKIPVLNLTESNPTRCGFHYLESGLLDALGHSENLKYEPDAHGLLKAREAVANYYAQKGIAISPEQIFLTANTSEAYSFVFRLMCNAGDSILAPQPSYPLLDYLAQLNDIHVVRYPLVISSPHLSPLPEGEEIISKIFLVVNPNNPTGNYVRAEEIEKTNRLAKSAGMAVISDEVFFDFNLIHPSPSSPLRGEGRVRGKSFASNHEVLTFTLSGISKILGLPQMKLSWIVVTGPEAARREAISKLQIISDTYLSVSAPAQHALPIWLEKQPAIRQEILRRISENLAFLEKNLAAQNAITLFTPEGGWSAVLQFPSRKSDEEWAEFLLEKEKILLHPGYLFDFEEGSFLVLSLLAAPEIFQEGIRRIVRAGQLLPKACHPPA